MTITVLNAFVLLERRNIGQSVCNTSNALGQVPHHARVWVKTGNLPLSPGWGTKKKKNKPSSIFAFFWSRNCSLATDNFVWEWCFSQRERWIFSFLELDRWQRARRGCRGPAVHAKDALWLLFLPHLLQPCGQRCPPWRSVARQPHRNRETSTLLLTHPFGTWALWGNPFSQEGNDNKSTCWEAQLWSVGLFECLYLHWEPKQLKDGRERFGGDGEPPQLRLHNGKKPPKAPETRNLLQERKLILIIFILFSLLPHLQVIRKVLWRGDVWGN